MASINKSIPDNPGQLNAIGPQIDPTSLIPMRSEEMPNLEDMVLDFCQSSIINYSDITSFLPSGVVPRSAVTAVGAIVPPHLVAGRGKEDGFAGPESLPSGTGLAGLLDRMILVPSPWLSALPVGDATFVDKSPHLALQTFLAAGVSKWDHIAGYLPEGEPGQEGRRWDFRWVVGFDQKTMDDILSRVFIGLFSDGEGVSASWPTNLPGGYSIAVRQWMWWRCLVWWGSKPQQNAMGDVFDTAAVFERPNGRVTVASRTEVEEPTASRVHTNPGTNTTYYSDIPAVAVDQIYDIVRFKTGDLPTFLKVEMYFHTMVTVTYTSPNGYSMSSSAHYYWMHAAYYTPGMDPKDAPQRGYPSSEETYNGLIGSKKP